MDRDDNLHDSPDMVEPAAAVEAAWRETPAMALAKKGVALRRQRKFFEALTAFDQAIAAAGDRDIRTLSYAYAHRGETKMALGYYCNEAIDFADPGVAALDNISFPSAIADFRTALGHDGAYGWAMALLGEAHRCQARTYYQTPASENFEKHIEQSLLHFEKAREHLPETVRPWVLAHMGASLIARLEHRFGIAGDQSTDISETDDGQKAQDYLKAALKQNPRYAWARRCLAFLHAMGRRLDLAIKEFGDASLDNPNGDLHLLRAMALLSCHAAEWPDQGDGADQERRKELLDRSVYCSQVVLEQDAEDFLARAAYAMSLLKQMLEAGGNDPALDVRAQLISASARGELLNGLARLLLVTFELAVLASPHGNIEVTIDELRDNIYQMLLPDQPEVLWQQPVLGLFRWMNPLWNKSQAGLLRSRLAPADDVHGSTLLKEHFDLFLRKLFNQPTLKPGDSQ